MNLMLRCLWGNVYGGNATEAIFLYVLCVPIQSSYMKLECLLDECSLSTENVDFSNMDSSYYLSVCGSSNFGIKLSGSYVALLWVIRHTTEFELSSQKLLVHIGKNYREKSFVRDREIIGWLRTLISLEDDLGLLPSTHIAPHKTL